MDSRPTFLHMYGGFTRGIGEGQWRGSTVIPWARRKARTAKTKKAIVQLTEDSKDIEIFSGL